MGLRFQKRIKILPGVTINVSKSGLSTSLGVKGARVTLGHGKTRTTMGIPGTGISHTSVTSSGSQNQAGPSTPAPQLGPTHVATVPPFLEKVGRFIYKLVFWMLVFFIFLATLSLLIQHFTK